MVTVWAKEQKYKNKESFYISQKSTQNKTKQSEEEENPLIHKFGKEFEKKDLFVAWHYNPKTIQKNKLDDSSENKNSSVCEETETAKEKKEKVYLRFYHVMILKVDF